MGYFGTKNTGVVPRDRIEGVKRFGRAWAIPNDAEKPVDAHVTTGEYRNWRKKS